MPVQVGSEQKMDTRIVAIKVPDEVAEMRRRKKLKGDSRKKYSADYLYLLGWNIFITNVPKERLGLDQIIRIYGLRWRIEIIFKAWKSKLNLAELFKKQFYTLASRAIIQFNLVLICITLMLTRWYKELFDAVLQKTGRILSLLKFAGLVQKNLDYLNEMYHNNYQQLIQILAYQYSYDKRKDRINFVEMLYNKNLT